MRSFQKAEIINVFVSAPNETYRSLLRDAIIAVGAYPSNTFGMPAKYYDDTEELMRSHVLVTVYTSEDDYFSGMGFNHLVNADALNIPRLIFCAASDLPDLDNTLIRPRDVVASFNDETHLLAQAIIGLQAISGMFASEQPSHEQIFKMVKEQVETYDKLQLLLESQRANSLATKPIFGKPDLDTQFNCDIFMIMPFSEDLSTVYADHIKPTVAALGWDIKRGDDPFSNHDIMHEIWSLIFNAALVIADCSARNPNVFYELGIAHTLGKPAIMITQNIDDIPFDVRSKRAIEYQPTPDGLTQLEKDLRSAVWSILGEK